MDHAGIYDRNPGSNEAICYKNTGRVLKIPGD